MSLDCRQKSDKDCFPFRRQIDTS